MQEALSAMLLPPQGEATAPFHNMSQGHPGEPYLDVSNEEEIEIDIQVPALLASPNRRCCSFNIAGAVLQIRTWGNAVYLRCNRSAPFAPLLQDFYYREWLAEHVVLALEPTSAQHVVDPLPPGTLGVYPTSSYSSAAITALGTAIAETCIPQLMTYEAATGADLLPPRRGAPLRAPERLAQEGAFTADPWGFECPELGESGAMVPSGAGWVYVRL